MLLYYIFTYTRIYIIYIYTFFKYINSIVWICIYVCTYIYYIPIHNICTYILSKHICYIYNAIYTCYKQCYIYIYIHIYIYMYIYIYTYIYVYTYIHIYIYIYIHNSNLSWIFNIKMTRKNIYICTVSKSRHNNRKVMCS